MRKMVMLFLLCDFVSRSLVEIEFYLSDKKYTLQRPQIIIFFKIYFMISDILLPFTGTLKMIS